MRQPLKERIQNAINQAILHEEVAYGALIVGGRRVTRKKRRNKPVKKDQNNNKKNNKKQPEKNKKYFKLVEEEEEAKVTLIKHEEGVDNTSGKTAEDGAGVKGENVKLNVKDGGTKSSTEGGDVKAANTDVNAATNDVNKANTDAGTTNTDVNTNSADGNVISSVTVSTTSGVSGGDAGSKDDKKTDVKKNENEKNDDNKNEINDGKNDAKAVDGNADIKDEKVKSVKDAVKDIEGEDGGGEKSTVNGTVMKPEKTSVKGGSDQGKEYSKEKSPLLERESNVKDTGPGVLCCNIL